MEIYISTSELLDRYGISKGTLINWRSKQEFPEPVIKAHGHSNSRYGIKAVDAWERRKGLLDALNIEPLMSNLS